MEEISAFFSRRQSRNPYDSETQARRQCHDTQPRSKPYHNQTQRGASSHGSQLSYRDRHDDIECERETSWFLSPMPAANRLVHHPDLRFRHSSRGSPFSLRSLPRSYLPPDEDSRSYLSNRSSSKLRDVAAPLEPSSANNKVDPHTDFRRTRPMAITKNECRDVGLQTDLDEEPQVLPHLHTSGPLKYPSFRNPVLQRGEGHKPGLLLTTSTQPEPHLAPVFHFLRSQTEGEDRYGIYDLPQFGPIEYGGVEMRDLTHRETVPFDYVDHRKGSRGPTQPRNDFLRSACHSDQLPFVGNAITGINDNFLHPPAVLRRHATLNSHNSGLCREISEVKPTKDPAIENLEEFIHRIEVEASIKLAQAEETWASLYNDQETTHSQARREHILSQTHIQTNVNQNGGTLPRREMFVGINQVQPRQEGRSLSVSGDQPASLSYIAGHPQHHAGTQWSRMDMP